MIEFIKGHGLEVRFSSEDSFRSDLVDLLTIYREGGQGTARVTIVHKANVLRLTDGLFRRLPSLWLVSFRR